MKEDTVRGQAVFKQKARWIWVQTPTPSLTSYVILSNLFQLSEPWSLYLKNEHDNPYLTALVVKKKKIMPDNTDKTFGSISGIQ